MYPVVFYRDVYDMLVRFLGVGIFAIENFNHIIGFHSEVSTVVSPALSPLPESLCSIVHIVTIGLGLTGSLMFMLSGFKRFQVLVIPSLRALLIFMIIITWNWWFRRAGEFIWDVVDSADRRNRIVHCLKNTSIFGLLSMIYRGSRCPVNKQS